jgi:hypothetical protein
MRPAYGPSMSGPYQHREERARIGVDGRVGVTGEALSRDRALCAEVIGAEQ